MKHLDLRKELKPLYRGSARKVEWITVPKHKYLMIDGELKSKQTPASSPQFQEAIGALYGAAFTLKFMSKLRKRNPIDYPVMALEGLWWTSSGPFDLSKKRAWKWRLMILHPPHITEAMLRSALQQLQLKQSRPALARIKLRSFREGASIQILYVGPYDQESRSVAQLEAFAKENGYRLTGKHHEIYLGDPRRARPDKLRTILRHPVSAHT